MVALKVFAALLVVCVASASAGPLQWDKPTEEDTTALAAEPKWFNPFACVGHFPETWNVMSELIGFWKEYKSIQSTVEDMKKLCEGYPDQASKEVCIKNAEELGSTKTTELLKKTQEIIPRVAKLLWSYKECLFG